MKTITTTLLILLAGSLSGANIFTKTPQGVTIAVKKHIPGQTALVRLQVMGEKIIRVSATAEEHFPDPQSIVVIPQHTSTPYSVSEEGDTVTVSTSMIKAKVNGITGEVWFTDIAGKIILQEQKGGGKHFAPYRVTQTHADGKDEEYCGWAVSQVVESPDDEAFYGLGQHQADEWNYKGKDEELFQYNTKVSIPFVFSSRNYGILLDSYSLCRFGNPNEYSQLHKIFRLYDKTGKEGALTGTYSNNQHETLVRREDSLYFENLKTAKNLPDFNLNKAKVVYEGEIEPMESGEYRFCHY